jgi:predicted small integral membrane protein
MLASRLVKLAFLASAGLFLLIVVLNNTIWDYASNYAFVNHVLSMDSLFSGESQRWRALADPTPEDGSYWLHHLFYWTIILWEAAAAVLCFIGAWQLYRNLKAPAAAFNAAKKIGIYGLGLTLLQWFVAFITVGGEWFLMWQSSTWNGQTAAGRMFMCFGIMLIVLMLKDEEVSE